MLSINSRKYTLLIRTGRPVRASATRSGQRIAARRHSPQEGPQFAGSLNEFSVRISTRYAEMAEVPSEYHVGVGATIR